MTEANDNSSAQQNPAKKKQKPLERVTIDEGLRTKLNNLVGIANESLQGVAEVNRSDIMNLLLKMHSDDLSPSETEELRKTHFDVFKCLTWLQHQAKDAKEKGAEVSLKDLLAKTSEFMVDDSNRGLRKPRKSKVKKTTDKLAEDPKPPDGGTV